LIDFNVNKNCAHPLVGRNKIKLLSILFISILYNSEVQLKLKEKKSKYLIIEKLLIKYYSNFSKPIKYLRFLDEKIELERPSDTGIGSA